MQFSSWSLEYYCIFYAEFHEASKCLLAAICRFRSPSFIQFRQECRKYGQKFIYTRKWNMTLCPDFHKNCIHSSKWIWKSSLPNFIQIWRKTCKMWYFLLAPLREMCASWHPFSQSSVLNGITWRYPVPIFTQIIQERLKLRAYVKCDCHCADCYVARSVDCVVLMNSLPSFLDFRQKVYRWW
jgi:hypothetical protein